MKKSIAAVITVVAALVVVAAGSGAGMYYAQLPNSDTFGALIFGTLIGGLTAVIVLMGAMCVFAGRDHLVLPR